MILTDLNPMFVFLYNKNHMFMPSYTKLFGSTVNIFRLDLKATKGIGQQFEITRTRWKALDQPKARCDSSNESQDTMKCITEYVETQCGCTIPIMKSNLSRPVCIPEQYEQLYNLASAMRLDDSEMYTSVLPKCMRQSVLSV
jgi:hypothetical protein